MRDWRKSFSQAIPGINRLKYLFSLFSTQFHRISVKLLVSVVENNYDVSPSHAAINTIQVLIPVQKSPVGVSSGSIYMTMSDV